MIFLEYGYVSSPETGYVLFDDFSNMNAKKLNRITAKNAIMIDAHQEKDEI